MSVQVTGVAELKAKLDRIQRSLRSPTAVLEESAEAIREVIAAAYASQTSPAGAAWPPKRDGTLAGLSFIPVTSVDPEGKAINITVAHRAARFQFFGTSRLPARNPLPVNRDGSPDGSPVWARIAEIAKERFSGNRR